MGRLAPVTLGHGLAHHRIKEHAGCPPLVILGSTNIFTGKPPRDEKEKLHMLRTPFTFDQRREMARVALGESVEILGLPDRNPDPARHSTDFAQWLADIRAIEEQRGRRFVFHGGAPEDLRVLGETFETRVTVDRSTLGRGISATTVREHLRRTDRAALSELLHSAVIPLALDFFHENLKTIEGR